MITLSKNVSIAYKFVTYVVVIMFISLLTGVFLLSNNFKKEMTRVHMESVQYFADSLQETFRDSLEKGEMENFKVLLDRMKKIEGVKEITLYDHDFKVNLTSSDKKRRLFSRALIVLLFIPVISASCSCFAIIAFNRHSLTRFIYFFSTFFITSSVFWRIPSSLVTRIG